MTAGSINATAMVPAATASEPISGASSVSPGPLAVVDQSAWLQSPGGGVDQLFDYASFMWTAGPTGDVLGQTSPGRTRIGMNPANDWSVSATFPQDILYCLLTTLEYVVRGGSPGRLE